MTARDCSSTDIRSLLLRELKPALPANDTSVLPFRKKLNKSLAMHHESTMRCEYSVSHDIKLSKIVPSYMYSTYQGAF